MTASNRSASGVECANRKSHTFPGTANHAASPANQSDTIAPEAAAVAATLNACAHRSGSSIPAVTLTTKLRATTTPVPHRPQCRSHREVYANSVLPTLFLCAIVAAFSAITGAAGYFAVKLWSDK